jgi:hypothetical protein
MNDLIVAGAVVALDKPKSAAARWDVLSIMQSNPRRAAAAALALCWPKLGRKARKAGIDFTGAAPEVFGGRVLDLLLEQGASMREVLVAGGRALDLCAESLPGMGAVEEEEGNSDDAEDSTTT